MPGKTEDIAGLQQEIERVKAEAAAASAEIEQLEQQRALAPSYEAAVAGEERCKQLRWIVDHAGAVLPDLQARLAQALADRHRAALARHRAIGAQVYRQLRAALVEAGKAQALALRAREDAIKEIGEGQAQLNVPVVAFMGLLTPELLQLYFDQMDRVFAAPQPKPKPVAAVPKPAAPKPPIAAPPAPRPARPPRRDPPPAHPDQVGIHILRYGIDLGDGTHSVVGDELTMMADQARLLVLAGAADYLPKEKANG